MIKVAAWIVSVRTEYYKFMSENKWKYDYKYNTEHLYDKT